MWLVGGAVTVIFAALMSALLIVALMPWLKRYALAKPNVRSSHRKPTPQGAGIAVIAATLGAVGVALAIFSLGASHDLNLPKIVAAVLVMTCLGAIDDMRELPAGLRLILQAIVIAGIIFALPISSAWCRNCRGGSNGPAAVRRLMVRQSGQLHGRHRLDDRRGSDTAHSHAHGARHSGRAPSYGTVVALALCGAMIGFAYFNRPVAKVFLGDVGSLPIGLILGWLLRRLPAAVTSSPLW